VHIHNVCHSGLYTYIYRPNRACMDLSPPLRGDKIKFVLALGPWPDDGSSMGGSRRAMSIITRSRAPGHAPVHSIIATLAPMLLDALYGVHRVAWTAAGLFNVGTDMATGCSRISYSTTVCRSRRSQTPRTDSCGPCGADGQGGQRAVSRDFGDKMHRICKNILIRFQ
jgi:hypothetical protein